MRPDTLPSAEEQVQGLKSPYLPEKLEPIGDRVLVKLANPKEDMGSQLIEMPDQLDRRKTMTGSVIGVGLDVVTIKVGDRVLLPGNAAVVVTPPGEQTAKSIRHVLIHEPLVYAIIRE